MEIRAVLLMFVKALAAPVTVKMLLTPRKLPFDSLFKASLDVRTGLAAFWVQAVDPRVQVSLQAYHFGPHVATCEHISSAEVVYNGA